MKSTIFTGFLFAMSAAGFGQGMNLPEVLYYQVDIGNGYQELKLDEPPSYLGGSKALTKSLNAAMKYPKAAAKNNVEGRIFLVATIDENDSLVDVSVVKGWDDFNEEAIEGLMKIKDGWIAGISDHKKVKSRLFFGVLFTLPKGIKIEQNEFVEKNCKEYNGVPIPFK